MMKFWSQVLDIHVVQEFRYFHSRQIWHSELSRINGPTQKLSILSKII